MAMPRYRAQVPYIDDLGQERETVVDIQVPTGDPDEISRAANDEWERLYPDRVGLLPEDLQWEQLDEEEEA